MATVWQLRHTDASMDLACYTARTQEGRAMKKFVPLAIAIVVGGVSGVFVWRHMSAPAPVDPGPEHHSVAFAVEEFIPTFDTDGDGRVTFEEFSQRYGKPLAEGEAVMIFHRDNGPPLTAEEAFRRWDTDKNGVVDATDLELISNSAWKTFSAEAEAKRLRPLRYNTRFMMLNAHQLRTFETEVGAMALKQVPWAGRFFDIKYLTQWVSITDKDGKTVYGFSLEERGRLWLLDADAKLTVHPEGTEPTPIDDAPQTQYAKLIAKTPVDDPALNLTLAKQCREWGLTREAGMLFARVLLFEPRNAEALDALDLVERDGHFFPKGE